MCGIYCAISRNVHVMCPKDLERRLQSRGPDCVATTCVSYPSATETVSGCAKIAHHSTVLGLRGNTAVRQPFGGLYDLYTLCWNGEAWNIGGDTNTSDTKAVYDLLSRALKKLSETTQNPDPAESAALVAKTLSRLAGPYAFVFTDQRIGLLFFGRDFLGRRSLAANVTPEGDLLLSSLAVGYGTGWSEVPADGVYCVDLRECMDGVSAPQSEYTAMGLFRVTKAPYHFKGSSMQEGQANASVLPRLVLNKRLPLFQEKLSPESPAVDRLRTLLETSLCSRVLNISPSPKQGPESNRSNPARIAVLFSGGLDCTVLARMSHDLLESEQSIDLLNVAFENPRLRQSRPESTAEELYELCPDRITGRASFAELQRTCGKREWRFVAINVPHQETLQHREEIIKLMFPHNTEMDLSIACALYFAARGKGAVRESTESDPVEYSTPARVLLSGLGADELFGGYTRHTTAFRRGGFQGLVDELELDVARLGQRNLGRDDRVMSNWGREVRFPFLDEELVSWALEANVIEKCGFGEESVNSSDLDPEKRVLRCLAWRLGITDVAKEKKRAIQFGARTAKMETGKTKGTTLLS